MRITASESSNINAPVSFSDGDIACLSTDLISWRLFGIGVVSIAPDLCHTLIKVLIHD